MSDAAGGPGRKAAGGIVSAAAVRFTSVMALERERPSNDREHARRWRRDPFAPARFDRPRPGPGGAGDRDPRDPRPRGGDAADTERPNS